MKEKEPTWRLDKVFKTYDMGEIKVEALRESSLDIPEGELLVILGPSGSGKSTLLNLLGVAQRQVPVIVTLPVAEDLKPGYEIRIVIETYRRSDSLLLPVESIRSGDGVRKVFRVEDGKIQETLVTTGITDRRMVEILEGLEEGKSLPATQAWPFGKDSG